ncbi:MAG: LptA/OstA family protein [Chthoniobacter sp.]
MIKNRFPILLAAALTCSPALAQGPSDKPLTESELLKQIETLKPARDGAATPSASPSPSTPSPRALTNLGSALLSTPGNAPGTPGDILRPQGDRPPLPVPPPPPQETANRWTPNAKPPTEITALEATFDQRANLAVFIGNVFVKDPQFNVDCDKLTAFLKHDDKPAPGVAAKGAPATPKPATATPNPATGGTPIANGGVKKQSGGLDKAIAVTTSERRVKITQDKVEADGSITHGIGIANRAEYFATSGDIYLYGMPDVTQGTNRCIATAPETWMKMNRDGRMEAHGPHKTIIVDTSDRDNKSATATQ